MRCFLPSPFPGSKMWKTDRLLVFDTMLATYSTFRIATHTPELKKPIFILGTCVARTDELPGIKKADRLSDSALPEIARTIPQVGYAVAFG
jgi:hypothetical protein